MTLPLTSSITSTLTMSVTTAKCSRVAIFSELCLFTNLNPFGYIVGGRRLLKLALGSLGPVGRLHQGLLSFEVL